MYQFRSNLINSQSYSILMLSQLNDPSDQP